MGEQFFLFSGSDYYPMGGAHDCDGAYSTIEDAKAAYSKKLDWAHVATMKDGKMKVVFSWPTYRQRPNNHITSERIDQWVEE